MAWLNALVALVSLLLVGEFALCLSEELRYQKKAKNYGVKLADWEQQIPIPAGMAWGYYKRRCPRLERIVKRKVRKYIRQDRGVGAGLLRLFFHDCFVQGCDASILLRFENGTELDDAPNLTIRQSALDLVEEIKTKLECCCPGVVSCADIVVLAASAAVPMVGGPSFHVPLGRRDSVWFSSQTYELPSPLSSFEHQISAFHKKGLNVYDLVALVGAHTLGIAWCDTFNNRLYPEVDSQMDPDYAAYLKSAICPEQSSYNTTTLDGQTPNKFDNRYYKNLPEGRGLLTSDQNLNQDDTAWGLVKDYACHHKHFFNQFKKSFIRMSQIQITRGSGEIRKVCCYNNDYWRSSENALRREQQKLSCKSRADGDDEDEDDAEEAELEELVPSADFIITTLYISSNYIPNQYIYQGRCKSPNIGCQFHNKQIC